VEIPGEKLRHLPPAQESICVTCERDKLCERTFHCLSRSLPAQVNPRKCSDVALEITPLLQIDEFQVSDTRMLVMRFGLS